MWDGPCEYPYTKEYSRGGLSLKTLSAARAGLVLTAVSLFSQAVGFVYRVALSRAVGSQVMGLYQLVMPVSAVLMSLTAVGFTVACSNLSARYHALGSGRVLRQAVLACVLGFFGVFFAVAALCAPLSDWISTALLGDARTQLGLLLLLPCVLLTGLENIHKHYFYGTGNVLPPALCEICEQLIRAGAVLGLLWRFLPQSPERTVGLILCGMILCEVFSAATLALLCRRALAAHPHGDRVEPPLLRKKIRSIALPIALTSLLGNLMGACTSVMIPQRLVRAGANVNEAMAAFGVLCGMTAPMLSLPMALIAAMGLILVPKLAESAALGRAQLSRHRVSKALDAVAICILPACALLAVLAPVLGQVLFKERGVGAFAVPLALGVALTSLESVLCASLNGLGAQRLNARNSLLCGAVQLFITWARMSVPGVGLRGYVEGFVLSSLLGLWLAARSVKGAIGLQWNWFRWLIAPGLASLLSALDANLLLPLLQGAGLAPVAACAAAAFFGAAVYLSAMSAMGFRLRKKESLLSCPN